MWLAWRSQSGNVPPLRLVKRSTTGVDVDDIPGIDVLRGIMNTVDMVVMETNGGVTLAELDTARNADLIAWWTSAWGTLMNLYDAQPKKKKTMRDRRHSQLAWSTWKGISTQWKKQRQASQPKKKKKGKKRL